MKLFSKKYRYLVPVMLLLTATACEKDLDFKYKTIPAITVIEASLDGSIARVAVMETTPMDEPLTKTLFTDAVVNVTDLSTGSVIQLQPDAQGLFKAPLQSAIDHEYQLTVNRQGNTYTSECRMYEPVEIIGMEFSWISMPYDEVAALQVSFYDTDRVADGDCYWVRLLRNGEAYGWYTLKDNLSRDGRMDLVVRTSRKDTDAEDDDEVLYPGDLMTARVCRISKEMYDYLDALESDSNGTSLFTGDYCLGYFLAAGVSEMTIEFTADF